MNAINIFADGSGRVALTREETARALGVTDSTIDEHLRCFWQRLQRKFSTASALWKLEPQERGAPHFHLLVWGVEFIPHEWIARAWRETVGSKEPDHLAAGTSVERAKSVQGVQACCSKKYLGKTVNLPDGWENVGRWWGVLGRKNLPRAPRYRCQVGKAQAFNFRRLIRRFFHSKGIHSSILSTLKILPAHE